MFRIDERVDYARVQQFATQIASVSSDLREEYAANFGGEQSEDFYYGLLAGYANAFVLASSEKLEPVEVQKYLGAIVAFVADRMAKQGL